MQKQGPQFKIKVVSILICSGVSHEPQINITFFENLKQCIENSWEALNARFVPHPWLQA